MMKMVEQQVEEVRRLNKNKRQLTHQALNLIMVITSALMIWRGLMGWTLGESPIVVVLSGSMEPAFQRGDILFLDNNKPNLDIGDIVVFKIKDRDIPIVHRVLKGDNNNVDDRGLYAPGQLWLQRGDIVGIARASIPYVGMATILMNDYPALKVLAVGLMAIMAFTQRE
ncbi:hypothetical protein SPRG_08134 [Saprolegnia parasitica CBS 223.65]|uniref:Signal peptidase complex catalytic subunit SEC11 n=1 Tax=Saprolegnia parasitica (strain CBS 223.65) TaxID=695850 RepID=A0A067C8L8_SAPPC|nr:hypothetical protein SPRG_08134 [Saprolegnia parasitica CBS 223.65]KDO26843.1 hypothetical protein SPRG_08134 [Saprolegnia parasitica CBS 223.65]|eukprot:XP_012202489.1 hypothetical protein SPRG_08134 [Saprolegnia parasitica CBS 223.65]